MKFENPDNGFTEEATTAVSWLWALLWPPLYYAVKGVWTHAIVSFVLGWVLGAYTFGLSGIVIGIIYAIMNNNIVRQHYLRKGWREVD